MNLGVSYTAENFANAIVRKDILVVKLFLDSGMGFWEANRAYRTPNRYLKKVDFFEDISTWVSPNKFNSLIDVFSEYEDSGFPYVLFLKKAIVYANYDNVKILLDSNKVNFKNKFNYYFEYALDEKALTLLDASYLCLSLVSKNVHLNKKRTGDLNYESANRILFKHNEIIDLLLKNKLVVEGNIKSEIGLNYSCSEVEFIFN